MLVRLLRKIFALSRPVFRLMRWGVFLGAVIVVLWTFYSTDPFTPKSFAAAGVASILLYFVLAYVFSHLRARNRIRGRLGIGEKVVYSTGYHIVHLLWRMWTSPRRWWIFTPIIILATLTLYYIGWGFYWLDGVLGVGWLWWLTVFYDVLPGDWNWALLGFGVTLIFSIPPTLYFVVEWSMHRYVITNERLLTHDGIFNAHMNRITLERVVDAEDHFSFIQQWLGYGDVALHLTSGGKGETLICVHRPIKFEFIRREASKLGPPHYHTPSSSPKSGDEV